ncbi:MAG: hypothetical protein HC831_25305 [Chloroflexia bacterium]|nr:hypothetical protein [Chloroflexia bacterium]
MCFIIPVIGQPTDGVIYKTTQFEEFYNLDHNATGKGGNLIEFRGDYIMLDVPNQMKKLWPKYEWEEAELAEGVMSISVEAYDDGGFKCLLNYGYDEVVDRYFLWVTYRQVSYCYWMVPTTETMWDVLDNRPPHDIPGRIEYTDEEIEKFIDSFGFFLIDFPNLN